MTVQYKTPGVYVEELDAFPPSIVGVDTAVPVFIGYTAMAEKNGRPVAMRPMRIASMVEYAAIFGGPYNYQFKLETLPSASDAAAAEKASQQADADKTAADAKAAATGATDDDKQKAATAATAATAAKAAADKAKADAAKADFKVQDKNYGLTLDKNFYLYNCLRLFYANGGGNCYIVSVGTYDDTADFQTLSDGLTAVRDLVGPTMLVIPEAVALDQLSFDKLLPLMLQQCFERQDRVAIIDVYGADSVKSFPDTINHFRDKSIGGLNSQYLKYGMAYAPYLHTSIVDPTEVSFMNFDEGSRATVKTMIDGEVKRLFPDDTPAAGSPPPAAGAAAAPPSKANQLETAFFGQLTAIGAMADGDEKAKKFKALNQTLTAQVPVFKDIYTVMTRKLGTLPPSAAMAGIYTQNDATRGVWNAPANVGIVAVTEPAVPISTDIQNDLNMPIGGLAINAIRDFVGRGTLVWGARTLDGNSNDWRYIQVRRALIYIEQSVELALNKFVFDPNVAQTWVNVTSMIGSFLRGVWQAGGLMGASPAEAFTVQCGLGSTMTAQDVLEGRMIVQIKLQMVHPAEFIVLTFQQQMQGGA